jgi:hypothetical protein
VLHLLRGQSSCRGFGRAFGRAFAELRVELRVKFRIEFYRATSGVQTFVRAINRRGVYRDDRIGNCIDVRLIDHMDF